MNSRQPWEAPRRDLMPGQRILLQTTIEYTSDDWHVGRFSLLADALRREGHVVTARDRATEAGTDDPILANLSRDNYDQLWLFAVDVGNGITPAECASVGTFRDAGGAVFVTRDHMDLGSSVCSLAGIGAAHYFHTKQIPDDAWRIVDDSITTDISWPNFHSGSNGDVQRVDAILPIHPVLRRRDGSTLTTLPAHPHEGGVVAPASVGNARVVLTGTSKLTGRPFNIAVAIEPGDGAGRGWAESTFHHFADYNWDPRLGCPSFVTEPPSDAVVVDPALLDDTKQYVANLAAWLAAPETATFAQHTYAKIGQFK